MTKAQVAQRQFTPLNAEGTLADGPDLKDGGLTTLNLNQ
jgi:hypothetical protein